MLQSSTKSALELDFTSSIILVMITLHVFFGYYFYFDCPFHKDKPKVL